MLKNKIKKLNRNDHNGMTLIEVLITLAVISIMIVPIFDVFVKTKEINHKTATTVAANFIGQKVLEDLKSESELIAGSSVKQLDDFDVTVNITEISGELTLKPDNSTVNTGAGNVIPIADVDVKYKVVDKSTKLFVNNIEYTFTDPNFEIEMSPPNSGQVKVKLVVNSQTTKTEHVIGNIIMTDIDPANINLTVSGDVTKANFVIKNDTDFLINIYEIDDIANNVTIAPTITTGSGEIATYQSKRSSGANGKNETKLFTIELLVKKNGVLYERLVSTAKK